MLFAPADVYITSICTQRGTGDIMLIASFIAAFIFTLIDFAAFRHFSPD